MKIEKAFAVMIDRFRYKIDAADTLYEKITKVTDSDLWNDGHYEDRKSTRLNSSH